MRRVETVEWIPVGERLPVGNGPYLYTTAKGVVGLCTTGYLRGQSKVGKVIAWAEMPRGFIALREVAT